MIIKYEALSSDFSRVFQQIADLWTFFHWMDRLQSCFISGGESLKVSFLDPIFMLLRTWERLLFRETPGYKFYFVICFALSWQGKSCQKMSAFLNKYEGQSSASVPEKNGFFYSIISKWKMQMTKQLVQENWITSWRAKRREKEKESIVSVFALQKGHFSAGPLNRLNLETNGQ